MKLKVLLFVLLSFLVAFCALAGPLEGPEGGTLTTPGAKFLLGPEDELEISVWKDEALTKKPVVIRPDGKISFPLIGDVTAAGRTVEDLRQEIQRRIKVYVPDAPVTVLVLKIGSPKVYVVGKVAKPGVYIMGQYMRIMQVLAMAGGMTTFAKEGDILVIREELGKQKYIPFDYGRVASGKDLEKNIELKPGDTVVVP
jgi:polysaccharide biosynthesis/export protein